MTKNSMRRGTGAAGIPRTSAAGSTAIAGALVLAGLLTACSAAAPVAATGAPSVSPSTFSTPSPAPVSASPTPTPKLGPSSLPSERPADYAIEIRADGAVRGYLTVAALNVLPQVTIDTPTAGMPQQTGGTVRAVLDAAGVRAFTSMVITGPNGATTVGAADLTDTDILGVSKRQTIRFSGEHLDKDFWVQDVTTIEVTL